MNLFRCLSLLMLLGALPLCAQATDVDKTAKSAQRPDNEHNELEALRPALDGEWKLVKNDTSRDIRTYSRIEDDKPYRSFKVESTIHAPLNSVGKVLADFENYGKWYWQVTQIKLLKQVSPNEFYLYLVHNAPAGLPDHDVILQVTVEPVKDGQKFARLRFQARPDYLPPKPPLIRILAEEVVITLTPTEDNQVHIEATGYFNPGGNEPVWASNLVQRNAPYSIAAGLERLSRLGTLTNSPAFLLTSSR